MQPETVDEGEGKDEKPFVFVIAISRRSAGVGTGVASVVCCAGHSAQQLAVVEGLPAGKPLPPI
ncbi:hypothetical protein [Micromonospora chokoriensis]